jgi:hypothetical protein
VLSFSGEAVTYRELLLTGAASGLLSQLVADAADGERLLRQSVEGPPRDAVRAEASSFRRARHLESGEDLRVWLSSRGLTLDQFDRYTSRVVARTQAGSQPGSDEPDAGPAGADPDAAPADAEPDAERAELTSTVLFSELAFSGAWRAFADTAVRLFAAERLSGQDNPSAGNPNAGNPKAGNPNAGNPSASGPLLEAGQDPTAADELGRPLAEVLEELRPFGPFDPVWCAERLEVLRSRGRALENIEQQTRASETLKARLENYRLEWALFGYDELPLRSQAAAMEALSCARLDRLPAEEIARRAGAELASRRRRREELPARYAGLLDSAAQDEAVGPIEREGGFSVLWLRHRSKPDHSDPEIAERALAELLSEALGRAATGEVREMGQL